MYMCTHAYIHTHSHTQECDTVKAALDELARQKLFSEESLEEEVAALQRIVDTVTNTHLGKHE